MERKINFVIKGDLGSGEILSTIGKNKAGEPSIIFYSQQKPSGWFDQLKLDAKKLFGTIRSGTEVATKYSNELGATMPERTKNVKTISSFSTPQALQVYLNAVQVGSHSVKDSNGVTTKVNIEI
jgi:hypothetical protein